jgi:hypothetical protein
MYNFGHISSISPFLINFSSQFFKIDIFFIRKVFRHFMSYNFRHNPYRTSQAKI